MCAVFAVVGVFAPLLTPVDPQHQDLTARLRPPLSPGHVFGTDMLGRDILSRLIAGARESLMVAVVAVAISVVVGVAVGLVSGYFGGLLDSLLMRFVDAWLAFPFLLLAITIIAILGPGTRNVIIALVASEWVVYVRLVRGETLSIREREYVTSARVLGVSRTAIMVKHILPNIYGPILVVSTLELGIVIVTEASLVLPRARRQRRHRHLGSHARRRAGLPGDRVVARHHPGPRDLRGGARGEPARRRVP